MESKRTFISKLELRIKKFVIQILILCKSLPKSESTRVINYQLIKSSTSTGANHRAAGRARSKAEFHSKLCIAVEEIDETKYWLEIIKGAKINGNQEKLDLLLKESEEILKILVTAKYKVSKRK